MSILDIVDSCRIWESHGEPADTEHRGQSLERRQRILPRPSPKISNSGSGVGGRGPVTNSPPWRVDHNMADRELLIRTVLEVVRERQGTDMNDGRDRGQCFSCGFLGHGMNRCTQLNISFPYLTPGWSVELRDGEYRVSKLKVDGPDSTQGKEGWFGREGQPPGPSVTITRLTKVGAVVWFGIDNHGPRWIPDVVQMGWEPSGPLGRLIKAPRRQMRPARNGGLKRRMTPTGRNDTGKKSSSRPMPTPAQARSEQAGQKTKSDRPGGIMPTAVAEPPLPEAGGGG